MPLALLCMIGKVFKIVNVFNAWANNLLVKFNPNKTKCLFIFNHISGEDIPETYNEHKHLVITLSANYKRWLYVKHFVLFLCLIVSFYLYYSEDYLCLLFR
jgi:hypothetical protein